MRSALLWDITQRLVLIPFLMFRDNLWVPSSNFKNPGIYRPLKMGPIGGPETSVRNHSYTLQSTTEERRSQTYVSLIIHVLHATGTIVRF